MTELELIVDFHKDTPRQGPGSDAAIKKALQLLGLSSKNQLKIADIGCGTGGQTLSLARQIGGHITAVDLFPEFLDKLKENAIKAGLEDRISTLQCSMDALPFKDDSLDLIWSEGAIYNIGFKNGLEKWKPFLKRNGLIAVTEISWFKETRPSEIEAYWKNAYYEIDSISNNIKTLESLGFQSLGHFNLPEYCWLDNYYQPIIDRVESFQDRHEHNKAVKSFVQNEMEEIEMYRKYKEYYGYTFYLARNLHS